VWQVDGSWRRTEASDRGAHERSESPARAVQRPESHAPDHIADDPSENLMTRIRDAADTGLPQNWNVF
jgi:hypothetical protein